MSIPKTLRAVLRFSPAERIAILLAYAFLLKARLLLIFCSRSVVEEAVSASPSLRRPRSGFSQRELDALFRIAWRYQFPWPKCLVTALAQRFFLAHYGHAVSFKIGVQKNEGRFQAHAWCGDRERPYVPLEAPSS